MKRQHHDPHASPAARTAQDVLLTRLRQEGGRNFRSVHEAIKAGCLTDLDWCEELDRQRERYGVTRRANPEPYGRRGRA